MMMKQSQEMTILSFCGCSYCVANRLTDADVYISRNVLLSEKEQLKRTRGQISAFIIILSISIILAV